MADTCVPVLNSVLDVFELGCYNKTFFLVLLMRLVYFLYFDVHFMLQYEWSLVHNSTAHILICP